jgi:hypothetical protein
MPKKIPVSKRLIVNGSGGHVHVLGDKHAVENQRHPSIWELHKQGTRTDQKPAKPPNSDSGRPSTETNASDIAHRYGKCKSIINYGSASTVRLHHKEPNDLYAVKVIHLSRHDNPPKASHVEDHHEASPHSEHYVALDLHHAHLVKIFDLVDDYHDLSIVMEYCQGGDLLSLISESTSGRLERVEADCFFWQLMHGLGYLHDQGIAHRNLKTQNILLNAQGCVKITALESAVSVHPQERHMAPRSLRRQLHVSTTPSYVAPERLAHEGRDLRTGDVWAAALIYTAMRIGRLLWAVAEKEEDSHYGEYLTKRSQESFGPIEDLELVSWLCYPVSLCDTLIAFLHARLLAATLSMRCSIPTTPAELQHRKFSDRNGCGAL